MAASVYRGHFKRRPDVFRPSLNIANDSYKEIEDTRRFFLEKEFLPRVELWKEMSEERNEFENYQRHQSMDDRSSIYCAIAEERLLELSLIEDLATKADHRRAFDATIAVEEREEMAEQAVRWEAQQKAIDDMHVHHATTSRSAEEKLRRQRVLARYLPEWREAFQVNPDAGDGPVSAAEEEALLMAESLWCEQPKTTATAIWHAAVTEEMGRDLPAAIPQLRQVESSATALASQAELPVFLRRNSTAEARLRGPLRRGEYDAEAYGKPYSRTDSVWKARVDDWMYHGGRKTRRDGGSNPDDFSLTTEDPFPHGSRARGVKNWCAENAMVSAIDRDSDHHRTLHAEARAMRAARLAQNGEFEAARNLR